MAPFNVLQENRNRAVSPVIGVILMVAITVILAAVIGAFVLEIGDQQETAPSTSFDSEQKTKYYESNPNTDGGSGPAAAGSVDGNANLTTVYITHAGGEVLDIASSDIATNGNSTAVGVDGTVTPTNGNTYDKAVPQPNILETLGSNEAVEFSSGNEWNLIGDSRNADTVRSDAQWKEQTLSYYGYIYGSNDPNDGEFACMAGEVSGGTYYALNAGGVGGCGQSGQPDGNVEILSTGDPVNVIWEASSGGKTQTLFKYTIQ